MSDPLLYFESSWAILSTIGLINVIFGSLVVGITGVSPITLVPIIVSIAGAVANGLCFFAFYENHNKTATLIAAIFADLGWLVQEAGLSFYSYLILTRVLKNRARLIFLSLFWFMITIITGMRLSILSCRARNIINGNNDLQRLVSIFHAGYFVSIAVVEILSAVFLLRIFAVARKASVDMVGRGGLFGYLMQSTEIRLATLALIGITRAITYSFQTTKNASDITGQIDRFVFTLECMFPVIMFIDILASRIASLNHSQPASAYNQTGYYESFQRSSADKDTERYTTNHTETKVVASVVEFSR